MTQHDMLPDIARCRHLAWRHLSLRLKVFERVQTIAGQSSEELDADIGASLMAGLVPCGKTLPSMKIMGAIINPLYQSPKKMLAAGLVTQSQYDYGKRELLDRMARYYERKQSGFGATVLPCYFGG